MKRNRKTICKLTMITCAAVVLAFLFASGAGNGGEVSRRYTRLPALTQEQYNALTASREQRSGEDAFAVRVLYGERSLPYDARTNTFMRFPRVQDTKLTVRAAQETEEQDHGSTLRLAALPQEQGFVVYSADAYSVFAFQETKLPVIVLYTEENRQIGAEHYEDIALTVYNQQDGSFALDMAADIHTRGASSSWIDKKSYRLKLDSIEGHVGKRYGLLGMKPAREWVLYALYGDESKMREKFARDVWNQIAADSSYADLGTGLQMEYCEVYLNDDYIGLYGLGTAIDRENYWEDKTQERQDLLFKSVNFTVPTKEELAQANAGTEAVGCLELKYASWRSDTMWRTIGEYLTLAYHGSDEEYISRMKSYMNVDNHIDYWLFLLAAGLDDNELKNIYFALEDAKHNTQVLLTPWDLDLSWGVGYTGEDIFMWSRNELQYKKIMEFPIVSRMFDLQDAEMIEKTRQRWAYLRQTVLTEDNLLDCLTRYDEQIWRSGVMERERQRWPDAKYASDTEYIERYVRQRLPYLDAYMAQLGEGGLDDGRE